jgi:HEAT repeat protein
MLALLEDDMASTRLAALEAIGRLQKADAMVVKALFRSRNNDSNTNVRLAALEALIPFVHKPEVRKGLVYAMASQEDAMVQISLAETLLQIQAKEAVPVLQDIIRSDHVNAVAKEKIKETVAQLVM